MTFENIEFIAIDLDGTLLDDKKNISKNSIEALQNTINKGIRKLDKKKRKRNKKMV